MDILKQADLKPLLETSEKWCVSIYMPTHKFGREQQQDPIRFKNVIVKAQDRLLEHGLRRPEVQELTRQAEGLLTNADFWQHQSYGLAVFLSPNYSRTYRLPSKFDELVVVADNFHIKPLIPILSKDRKFYILTLSINKTRLFSGTRDQIDEVDLGNIPTSMKQALWMDDPEKHTEFHTGASSPGRGGKRQAIFHGHGSKSSEEKTNLRRYFQYVDRGLNELLEDRSIPMVLAGVEYLLPIYHQVNSYDGLLDKGIEGNPDELDEKTLLEHAWEIVEPIFKEKQEQALEQFTQLHGQQNQLAAADIKTVVKAANFGQVETLFVPLGVQKWGRYDAQKNTVIIDKKPEPENADLFDFAAIHTLFNSGSVYAVQPEKMPGDGELAAILRYAA